MLLTLVALLLSPWPCARARERACSRSSQDVADFHERRFDAKLAANPMFPLLCRGERLPSGTLGSACGDAFTSRLAGPRQPCARPLPNATRVAVCLAGAVRTLNEPLVFEAAKRHLLRAVAPRRGDVVETFLYLSLRDGTVHVARQPATAGVVFNVSADALAALAPVAVRYATGDAENCAFPRRNATHNGTDPQGLVNILHQDTVCADMIERREREAGARFTHVVRSRPDLLWYLPAPRPCDWLHGLHFRDWAWLLPRDAVHDVLRRPSGILAEACEKAPGALAFLGTEETRYRWNKELAASPARLHNPPFFIVHRRNDQHRLDFEDYNGEACARHWGCDQCELLVKQQT